MKKNGDKTRKEHIKKMISVSNISSLYATTGSAEVSSVYLLGYYNPGDGADGLFVWNSGSSELDNGGTIIVPTVSGSDGFWKRTKTHSLDVRWFGARGDGITNDSPAFASAVDALGPLDSCVGGRLKIGPETYRLADNLIIDRVMVLEGAVGYRNYASSKLLFDDGYGVFFPDCPIDSGGRNPAKRFGANSLIEHVVIQSKGDGVGVVSGGLSVDRPLCHGVWAQSPFRLRDVFIVGFNGDGIFVDSNSDVGGDFPNCNGFQLQDVSCENNTKYGLHIKGGNAQGGYTLGYFGMSNGLGHLLDESFLGNVHLAPMAHTPLYPGVVPCIGKWINGELNMSTIIGGYTEADCSPSHIDGHGIQVGGTHGSWFTTSSTGLRMIDYQHVSPFQVQGNGVNLQLGFSGNVLSFQADDEGSEVRLSYGTGLPGWYELIKSGRTMLSISGEQAVIGPGHIMLPDGVLIAGPGAYPAKICFGKIPTGQINAGALCLSSDTLETGVEGWRCTRTGFSAAPWLPNKYYDAGEYCTPTPDGDWMYFKCTTTGISGATQPVFVGPDGNTVTDGTCVWTKQVGYSAAWRVFPL